MPTAEALKNRLKRMTAWDKEPALSSADLDDLLSMYARADANGVAPEVKGWQPTYDLNGAAAEGWRWKSAKASELVSVDLDGERMSSNQLFAHCNQMARMYASRRTASVSFGK